MIFSFGLDFLPSFLLNSGVGVGGSTFNVSQTDAMISFASVTPSAFLTSPSKRDLEDTEWVARNVLWLMCDCRIIANRLLCLDIVFPLAHELCIILLEELSDASNGQMCGFQHFEWNLL